MKKELFFLVLLLMHQSFRAQVGINTRSPQAMLDIVSVGNSNLPNIFLIENSDKTPILTVKNDGRVGMGVSAPITRLDLRDGKDNSIVAVGESTQTPAAAQPGAIRYNPSQNLLNYSDGNSWVKLSNNKIKAKVTAILPAFTFPNATTVSINNWSKVLDVDNSFDAVSGIFTAQSDGIYSVSFEMVLQSGSLAASSYITINISSSGGRTAKSISAKESSGNYYVDAFCASSFEMQTGQTLAVSVWHNFGTSKSILSGYNSLTIIEN